jgi:hypothetical protein
MLDTYKRKSKACACSQVVPCVYILQPKLVWRSSRRSLNRHFFFPSLVNSVSPMKSRWGLWYGACSRVLNAVPFETTQKRSRFKGFRYYGPTFVRLPRYLFFIPRYVACTSLFALSRGVECGEVLFSHTLHVVPCDFCI